MGPRAEHPPWMGVLRTSASRRRPTSVQVRTPGKEHQARRADTSQRALAFENSLPLIHGYTPFRTCLGWTQISGRPRM